MCKGISAAPAATPAPATTTGPASLNTPRGGAFTRLPIASRWRTTVRRSRVGPRRRPALARTARLATPTAAAATLAVPAGVGRPPAGPPTFHGPGGLRRGRTAVGGGRRARGRTAAALAAPTVGAAHPVETDRLQHGGPLAPGHVVVRVDVRHRHRGRIEILDAEFALYCI